jgi:hypothetical protein
MAGCEFTCPTCEQTVRAPLAGEAQNGLPLALPTAAQPPGPVCAICQSPLGAGEPQTKCPACAAPYHADCWQENGGCAVYGCAEVPPTEGRAALEIPAAYWGQERKPCPLCGQEILAAALRCRHCGATFHSARAVTSEQYTRQVRHELQLPGLKGKVVWWFVCALLPCTAPFAALVGGVWYALHREAFAALPSLHAGLARIALWTSLGQTVLMILMGILFAIFRGS